MNLSSKEAKPLLESTEIVNLSLDVNKVTVELTLPGKGHEQQSELLRCECTFSVNGLFDNEGAQAFGLSGFAGDSPMLGGNRNIKVRKIVEYFRLFQM